MWDSVPDGMFHKSTGYISHVHLGEKKQKKTNKLWKGRCLISRLIVGTFCLWCFSDPWGPLGTVRGLQQPQVPNSTWQPHNQDRVKKNISHSVCFLSLKKLYQLYIATSTCTRCTACNYDVQRAVIWAEIRTITQITASLRLTAYDLQMFSTCMWHHS